MAIADIRQITSQLFQQVDKLRGLLLGQESHFQIQMRSLFRELGEPILLGQHHGRGQQRSQTDNPLQPGKRRRIEFGHAKPAQYGVGDHPNRDKDQNEADKDRLPDKVADALEDPLRAADLLLFTRVEIQNGLDILAGLVAFGFEWRALAIRWRPRRNSSFGFHQGMLLDPACPDPLEKWNVTWVAT